MNTFARIASTVEPGPNNGVLAASIRESCCIGLVAEHEGVEIHALDMSSESATGTFKDWLACLTIARCLREGTKDFVAQTSGNTGIALATYAHRHGIRGTIFYPTTSRFKFDYSGLSGDEAQFVEVDCTEPELKRIATAYSAECAKPLLPTLADQLTANKIRAHFLVDYQRSTGRTFDWHAQALSAGYGVFGFYAGLEDLGVQPGDRAFPRLLGIQQQAVCPYAIALGAPEPAGAPIVAPTLFRSRCDPEFLSRMRHIRDSSNGEVAVLQNADYDRLHRTAYRMLSAAGLAVARRPAKDGYLEGAGLLGLCGVLRAIERRTIQRGESVLLAFTGGTAPATQSNFRPTLTLHRDRVENQQLGHALREG